MRKLFCCLFVLTMTLAAADVSGKWAGTGGEYKITLELKQEGEKLTGTFGRVDGPPWEIENGKVQGNAITFELNPSGRFQVKLELKGDQMKGTVATPDGLTMEVEVKRS